MDSPPFTPPTSTTWVSVARDLLPSCNPSTGSYFIWRLFRRDWISCDQRPTPAHRRHEISISRKEIPPEILHLIFQFVQWHPSPTEYHGKTPLAPEITLSHVCFSWRSVCLSSADLWSAFSAKRSSPTSHARLRAYLARSSSRLMELTFHFQRPRSGSSPTKRYSLLQDIIPHRLRWSTFTLSFYHDTEPLSFIREYFTPSQSPNLRSVTVLPQQLSGDAHQRLDNVLELDTDPREPATTPFYTCMNGSSGAMTFASLLNRVTDLRLDVNWELLPDEIHGTQIQWISWPNFLKVLSLPSLVSLSIQGQPYSLPSADDYEKSIGMIPIPHLKHLRYMSCYGSSAFEDYILPNIDAPNLETLTLARLDPPDTSACWNPKRLRSFPSLRKLVLVNFIEYDLGFAAALASLTSNISQLVLSGEERPILSLLSKVATQTLWESVEQIAVCDVDRRIHLFVGPREIGALMDACLEPPGCKPFKFQ